MLASNFSIQRVATLNTLGLAGVTRAVALCPGAEYGPAKRWPPSYFAEVARTLSARGDAVWLVGSAKDADIAQDIADDWDKQAEVWGDLTRLRELFERRHSCSLVLRGFSPRPCHLGPDLVVQVTGDRENDSVEAAQQRTRKLVHAFITIVGRGDDVESPGRLHLLVQLGDRQRLFRQDGDECVLHVGRNARQLLDAGDDRPEPVAVVDRGLSDVKIVTSLAWWWKFYEFGLLTAVATEGYRLVREALVGASRIRWICAAGIGTWSMSAWVGVQLSRSMTRPPAATPAWYTSTRPARAWAGATR